MFPTQIEELILRMPELSPHFQCVLTRPGQLDELTVRVEARPESASAERRNALAEQLCTRVKDTVGVTVTVDVVAPDSIERSVGKMKRIVDRRRERAAS